MSLQEISVTLDDFMNDNYSTPANINYSSAVFNSEGKSTWIAVGYNPIESEMGAFNGTAQGVEIINGLYTVRCYGKYKITSLGVADEVKNILIGAELDFRVSVGSPSITPPIDLTDGLWETTLNFKVIQF